MKIVITILNMKMITMTIMRGDKNVNNIDNKIHNDVFCLRIIPYNENNGNDEQITVVIFLPAKITSLSYPLAESERQASGGRCRYTDTQQLEQRRDGSWGRALNTGTAMLTQHPDYYLLCGLGIYSVL